MKEELQKVREATKVVGKALESLHSAIALIPVEEEYKSLDAYLREMREERSQFIMQLERIEKRYGKV